MDEMKPCPLCEQTYAIEDIVCYLPLDSGNSIDISINYCPKCGRKLVEEDGE